MCGHLFCWPCLHQWLDAKPNRQLCPVCKSAISADKVCILFDFFLKHILYNVIKKNLRLFHFMVVVDVKKIQEKKFLHVHRVKEVKKLRFNFCLLNELFILYIFRIIYQIVDFIGAVKTVTAVFNFL